MRLLLLLLAALPAAAQLLDPFEPTPFRCEALDNRGETYNSISFLQRLSYEPMPYLGSRRPLAPNEIRGTAGSVSSTHLYLRSEAWAVAPLDNAFFGEFRHRRHEDFDGTLTRSLFGFGRTTGPWRASLLGDVAPEKEDADVEGELRWGDEHGNRLRLTAIVTDAWFNTKNDEDSDYASVPFTFFASGSYRPLPSLALLGFIQKTPNVRFTTPENSSRDRSLSGGIGLAWTFQQAWTLESWSEALETSRRRVANAPDSPLDLALTRSWDAHTLELRRQTSPRHLHWIGVRYLHFQEIDHRPHDPNQDTRLDFHSTTLYLGLRRPLTERLDLLPSLFLDHYRDDRNHPQAPDEDYHEEGFQGKFGPALEWALLPARGATLTLNLTARLHPPAFGGGNLQLSWPF